MNSSITPFRFPDTGQQIRVIGDNEQPLIHHGDACRALEHTNPSVAIRMVDEDERVKIDMRTISAGQSALNFKYPATGNAEAWFLTEAGFYNLAFASKAKGAHALRRWVTHEVLPTIRRTGSYTAAPVRMLPDVTTPTGVLALAEQFVETARQLVEADDRIKELEPKALAHDVLIAAQAGDVLVRQAAKTLGWKERDLRTFLVDEHMLYRRQTVCGAPMWDFYAAHAAHFNATEQVVEHTWGSCAHYTVHVTPAGLALIQRRIERRKAELNSAITETSVNSLDQYPF